MLEAWSLILVVTIIQCIFMLRVQTSSVNFAASLCASSSEVNRASTSEIERLELAATSCTRGRNNAFHASCFFLIASMSAWSLILVVTIIQGPSCDSRKGPGPFRRPGSFPRRRFLRASCRRARLSAAFLPGSFLSGRLSLPGPSPGRRS